MSVVQITARRIEVKRVPFAEMPLLELDLEENQRVVMMEKFVFDPSRRKTTDWIFTVWIETRL